MNRLFLFFIFVVLSSSGFAKIYITMEVEMNKQEPIDSIIVSVYPYHLPIWGEKVTNSGYDIPFFDGINDMPKGVISKSVTPFNSRGYILGRYLDYSMYVL